MVILELMGNQAIRVYQVILVGLATQALVCLVILDSLDILVLMEQMGQVVFLALAESQVTQVLMEVMEQAAFLVLVA